MVSYQNQTAADIESGRARVDSVTSYGSGGSEESLLPSASTTRGQRGSGSTSTSLLGSLSSPRRTGTRENRPLLGGARARGPAGGGGGGDPGARARNNYEEIEDAENSFPGKKRKT